MRRRLALSLLAGLVLLLAGLALFFRPKAPEAPAVVAAATAAVDAGAPAVTAPSKVTLKAKKGTVEVRRGGSGAWIAVESGATLSESDVLRAGADGEAELVAGGHVVRVVGGTEVTVGELTQDLTSFLLGAGLLGAEASGDDGRTLEVRALGSDAVARATDGAFRMSSNGAGTVAVGATEGEVAVSGGGTSVVLKPGERTLVRPGEAPSPPERLATSLLLKVAWPEKRKTNQRVITVTGRTDAGALVFALGERIPVGADGTFEARVRLREGTNRVKLEAFDVSGNAASDDEKVVVDTRGAASRFKTDDLWRQ